jgi:hypothetical protein
VVLVDSPDLRPRNDDLRYLDIAHEYAVDMGVMLWEWYDAAYERFAFSSAT